MWLARDGPRRRCKLVRSLVEFYSEGDIEMVKFAKFWVLRKWNGMRGVEAERPFRSAE